MPAEALTAYQTDPDITDVTLYTERWTRWRSRRRCCIAGIGEAPACSHRCWRRLPVGVEEVAVGRVSAGRRHMDRWPLQLPVTSSHQYRITELIVPQPGPGQQPHRRHHRRPADPAPRYRSPRRPRASSRAQCLEDRPDRAHRRGASNCRRSSFSRSAWLRSSTWHGPATSSLPSPCCWPFLTSSYILRCITI